MYNQNNPFIQQAMQIQQQINPLIQSALQHGQVTLGEFNKIASISQNMMPVCDDVIQAINSGNTQRALTSSQNMRGMIGQLNQSTQFLSNSIAQKMDMALFMMNNAQQRIGALTNFIQSMRPQVNLSGAMPCQCQHTAYPYMS